MGALGALGQALMKGVSVIVKLLFPCSLLMTQPEMTDFCSDCCLVV